MTFAVNLLALVIVIGMSWVAMLWMSGRFHGERQDFTAEPFDEPRREVADVEPRGEGECVTCNGSGARKNQGRLRPCPVCEGTGALN